MSDTSESRARKVVWPERVLRKSLWFGLILFWVAYGLSAASFLVANIISDPRTLYNMLIRRAAEPATQIVVANSMHAEKATIILFVAAVMAWLAVGLWRRTQSTKIYPLWYGAFGLLLAIPAGLLLSWAIPVEYVRDYAAYLRLAQNLYGTGDYSEVSDGNMTGVPDVLAWRPPGVALLYGLPIAQGVPIQLSVWIINSVIALTVFFFVKRSLSGHGCKGSAETVAILGLVLFLSTCLLFLLPISHFPAIAVLCCLLLVAPARSELISLAPPSKWALVGVLIGMSALFRPNLVLEGGVIAATILIAAYQSGRTKLAKPFTAIFACALGVAVVIGPWSIRNWTALHRFVPISTNGGMVFYSSNGSPIASEQGHFVQALAVQLYRDVPNEVDRDREGWRRGFANIASHPAAFIKSFQYRIPRLLANPLFPINYVREQAYSKSWVWIFPLFEAATLFGFWWLWLALFRCRDASRAGVMDAQLVPWPQFSLLLSVGISLLFENSPTFQLSFLPFVLFILFEARALPRDAREKSMPVPAMSSR